MTFTLRQTTDFVDWLTALRDKRARARILLRLERLENGNRGLYKSVGEGILEIKVDYGPGYRLYFMQRGDALIVLLCGGDKRTQRKDIERARSLAKTWEETDVTQNDDLEND